MSRAPTLWTNRPEHFSDLIMNRFFSTVVAVPTFHDQETNAERLTATGIGAALHPRRWTAEELVAAVERVRGGEFRDRCTSARSRIRELQSQQAKTILSFA